MQKSDDNQKATVAHRRVMSSTTLNRKYVQRPTAQKVNVQRPVVQRPAVGRPVVQKSVASRPTTNRAVIDMANVKARMQKRVEKPEPAKILSAKELKDQAIKNALASVAKEEIGEDKKAKRSEKFHFGAGKILLALGCAAAAVFAIVYFVNLNMPDISLKVAAMQTGIDASYPSYVPRDFALSDIVSEDGRIVLNFKNSSTGGTFSLIEERSTWDSNALLSNYVRDAYEDNYIIIRDQGLTIYVSGNDAAWVNGGIVFKIKTYSGELTKKQIRSIAVSL